ELMNEPYDIIDKANARELANVRGEVDLENVTFRYEEEEMDVLKNVDLHVQEGETIALVGMSGGGKSTLISLIPRFYDVTGGTIRVDGMDIRDVKARSLRNNIGMVLQDNILFSESIEMNIRMGKPGATDEEVETIALVGMSGGGKSTLISLIPRFYDVTGGTIRVDGMDIRDVKARSLRNNIGMVLQDNILFSESIEMNIRMGKPGATDEEV